MKSSCVLTYALHFSHISALFPSFAYACVALTRLPKWIAKPKGAQPQPQKSQKMRNFCMKTKRFLESAMKCENSNLVKYCFVICAETQNASRLPFFVIKMKRRNGLLRFRFANVRSSAQRKRTQSSRKVHFMQEKCNVPVKHIFHFGNAFEIFTRACDIHRKTCICSALSRFLWTSHARALSRRRFASAPQGVSPPCLGNRSRRICEIS